ncbi:hypothetical protein ANCDUO_11372 [Ancylostoma duodenale]|uniref:Uncharacterized protein n=1 Tax=Ancylostoma duodenale TaxID=51022 RepID=A0A0C2GBP0_9BILA|nr:hypothetical protein ANCDUO_11372 [Ancylostoma duodenale]
MVCGQCSSAVRAHLQGAETEQQPNLPIAILPRIYSPHSCKPPLCNPYQSIVGFGVSESFGL